MIRYTLRIITLTLTKHKLIKNSYNQLNYRFKVQGSNSFILPKTEETKGTKNIIRGKETPIKAARSR